MNSNDLVDIMGMWVPFFNMLNWFNLCESTSFSFKIQKSHCITFNYWIIDSTILLHSLISHSFRWDNSDLFDAFAAISEYTHVSIASILNCSASSIIRSLCGIQDHEMPSSLAREVLLQHISDFLERRRRVRSQVLKITSFWCSLSNSIYNIRCK